MSKTGLKDIKIICTAILFLLPSCCNPENGKEKFEFTPDVFNTLFVTAKKSILDQFANKNQNAFRHIDYSNDNRGIFVRLCKRGQERGCVAFIKGVGSFENAVKTAAVNAAFFNSRYEPLLLKELNDIEIEITIIDRLIKIDNYKDFIPRKHTVYIKNKNNKAILQAQIAEEKNYNKEEYLKAICRKAGMDENSYKDRETEIFRANTVFMRKKFTDINIEK